MNYNDYKITEDMAITLGNFDSFHRGHMQLIDFTKQYAKKEGLCSAIFTTEPSTAEFFGKATKKILKEKKEFAKNFCDMLIEYKLNFKFLNMEPEKFLEMLRDTFNAKAIIVGENYKFGKYAKGTPDLIKKFAEENNIYFKQIELLKEDGEIISSTAIREAILSGNIKKANKYLGYPFFIKGEVIPTAGRGASIGFATANIDLEEDLIYPDFGVYLTKTTLPSGESLKSITNVGAKPTFGIENAQIETHILNFDKELYLKEIKVEFYDKIRDIVKFENVEALKKQLKADVEKAESMELEI